MQQVNPGHIVGQYDRATVHTVDPENTFCGEVMVTPFWVFIRGHDGFGDLVPGITLPREGVLSIEDNAHETCAIHDELTSAKETSTD